MVIWKVFLFQFWIYFWGSIHCVFSSISQKIHLFRIWRVVCLVSLSKVAKEKFVTILVQMTHASPCYIITYVFPVYYKKCLYITQTVQKIGEKIVQWWKNMRGCSLHVYRQRLKKQIKFLKKENYLDSIASPIRAISLNIWDQLQSNIREISQKFHFLSHFRASLMLQIE